MPRGKGLRRFFGWSWLSGVSLPGFRLPKAAEDELRSEIDEDLSAPEEPPEPLPDAEISEKEREEAVRRDQRELEEKGRR